MTTRFRYPSELPTAATALGADDLFVIQPGGAGPLAKMKARVMSYERLSADRTYYVRTDGNDGNTGLANNAAGAFKTLQKAVDAAYTLDCSGYAVTIQVADGTYTAGASLNGTLRNCANLYLIGNTTTPASCHLNLTTGTCFAFSAATAQLRGFKVSTASGNGITAYLGSHVFVQAMEYGACSDMHNEAGQGSLLNLSGALKISGNAGGHLHVGSFGLIGTNATYTLSGTPDFTYYFIGVAQGAVHWQPTSVTGSATGPKYLAHYGGLIKTNVTFDYDDIPGDEAGRMDAFGAIVGSSSEALVFAPDIHSDNALEIHSIDFNTQAHNIHFKVVNDLFSGKGYAYINGDDSYLDCRHHLGCAAEVDVTTGSADGITIRRNADGYTPIQVSAFQLPSLCLRRRNADGAVAEFYRDTSNVGSISVTTTGTSYNTSSDYRLKDAIAPLSDALAVIAALQPRRFVWRVDQTPGVGFIAHELASVVPEAVVGDQDATDATGSPRYQGVDPSKLVVYLTGALQELATEVENLRGRLEAAGL